jgi:adenine deaminase
MAGFEETIRAAKGQRPADLVLANGNFVNVLSGEIYRADVAVFEGKVVGIGEYEGKERIDVSGRFVCPGFLDGHVHIESSLVTVPEFARAVVPRGTTSVVIDPHEIANVLGIEGIQYMLKSSKFNPMNVFVMLPSCVPASPFETSGSILKAFDLYPFLSEKWVLGLGEVMNYPGVLASEPDLLDKIAIVQSKRIDGHAPGLAGKDLCAYVAAGIRSDHEGTTPEEAREKLRLGMHIMIREGSVTKNLVDLLPIVNDKNSWRCFFVTDDRHPRDILREGHIDHLVRLAIKAGLDPITAIRMATVNTASYFGLDGLGALAPGFDADILVISDLADFRVESVFKKGVRVAQNGEIAQGDIIPASLQLRSSVNIKWLEEKDFHIPARGARVRVMETVPEQILTRQAVAEVRTRNGLVEADVGRDLLKVAVIERHHASEKIGLAFVRGFGLRSGALGSSVAHDSHNIVVVGTDDRDMQQAAIEIYKMQGGLVAMADGKLLDKLPLPIAGLMSTGTMAEVEAALEHLNATARALGSTLPDPFMTLSFLALPVVPELKLTNQGLVDVGKFELVDLFL